MSAQDPFVKAEREQAKWKLAIIGPSGSGKSFTALQIASEIVRVNGKGKIAVIDSEGRRSRAYAGKFDFSVKDMAGDFSPSHYIEAINDAVKFGYSVLVIDGLSPAWDGSGGVLEIVDRAASTMKDNKWAGWATGRPAQNKLVETIVNADIHIIATMRSKVEWAQEMDSRGKMKPVKVGLGAIQSDQMEYEFLMAAMLDMKHTLTITKSMMDGCIAIEEQFTSIPAFVERAIEWLNDGVERVIPPPPPATWANAPTIKLLGERVESAFGTTLESIAKTMGIQKPRAGAEWNARYQTSNEAGKAIKEAYEKMITPPISEPDPPSPEEIDFAPDDEVEPWTEEVSELDQAYENAIGGD
jgi:hypothetical protein